MQNELTVRPGDVLKVLLTVGVLLVAAQIATVIFRFGFGYEYVKGFVPLFNMDGEGNFPAYLSFIQILLAGLILFFIAQLERKNAAKHVVEWYVLSGGFLLMALDEGIMLHERLAAPVRTALDSETTNVGIFYAVWTIPAGIIVILLGLYFLRFLLALEAVHRFRFMLAGALYLSGAIGMELVGMYYFKAVGGDDAIFGVLVTIEESLEIFAVTVFVWSLLKYCQQRYKAVSIRLY
ncbi:hypothetical protein [Hydrocarboniclastica marina]|uniref:hypothetical protein n=1 Tax=Hydrocarboniclastica marina TaxID=2259620 RepID=UPI0010A7A2EE|nr:hypothetical protein [Hydrocarboniclastica marina]